MGLLQEEPGCGEEESGSNRLAVKSTHAEISFAGDDGELGGMGAPRIVVSVGEDAR